MKIKTNINAGNDIGMETVSSKKDLLGACQEYWGNGVCLFKKCPYPPFDFPCDKEKQSDFPNYLGGFGHYI